jgi:hypothetical protein
MKGRNKRWLLLAAFAAVLAVRGHLGAQNADKGKAAPGEPAIPAPAAVKSVTVFPTTVALKGEDDSRQLIATGALAGTQLQDLTGDVKYEVANPKLARVTRRAASSRSATAPPRSPPATARTRSRCPSKSRP